MLAVLLAASVLPVPQNVQAKTTVRHVSMGASISVYRKGASYQTSDRAIAYVNAKGRVTGKKPGTVTITVKKSGKTSQIPVCVKQSQKKKPIKVCSDEIKITKNIVTFNKVDVTPTVTSVDTGAEPAENALPEQNEETPEETETTEVPENTETPEIPEEPEPVQKMYEIHFTAKVTLKNTAKEPVSKIVLNGKLNGKKLKFSVGKLGAGKSKTVTVKGTLGKTSDAEKIRQASVTPLKMQVTSNQMIHTYDFEKESMSLNYGTKDTKKPVFSGFIGKNSYNDKIPYQIVYSDQAEKYNFTKYVTVTDDRDTKVKIQVDTSKVNFKKTGTYKVIYRATDSAGNTAKTYAKIGVRVATDLDSYCDTILSRITKSSWSDTQKAKAIYNYTRGHIAYTGSSNKSNWEKNAISGIRYGRGDCYTYYTVARALLTRAGIPNIEVNRVAGHGHHWWNMVYVQGAFYHFDACPRKAGGRFCLVTDAQLKNYSSHYGNSHIWAYNKKPKSGTKVLSSIF